MGVEIVSAKSSEMNVVIPVSLSLFFVLGNRIELCAKNPVLAQDGDDVVEQPIPEQFKTTINGKKLITSATESV